MAMSKGGISDRTMGKKGFMKTIEAIIASLMLLAFIAFVIPTNFEVSTGDQLGVLSRLQLEQGFRTCVINDNLSCVQTYVEEKLPGEYASRYRLLVTSDNQAVPTDLPEHRITVESVYISTDGTTTDARIVRLYYWQSTT